MHILFCNFHEGYGGGHDTYLLSLIKALQTNHNVALACPPTSRLYLTLKDAIPCFGINFKAIFRQGLQLKTLRNFKQWIETQPFDIIHANGSADHRVVLLLYPFLKHRPKLVFTKHNALPLKWGAQVRIRYFTHAIIAVSQFSKKYFFKIGLHHSNKLLLRTIPNGIDTNFYKPIPLKQKLVLRQQYGLKTEDFIFVSNAGTAVYKNWSSLVVAIAALPSELKNKIKVIIIGNLPSAKELEKVQKLGLHNHFIFPGFLDDTRDMMTLGDVGFVLSNAVETISFACREMMAMGLPVIVSNYGGLPENITDHVDGWIVPVDDISALTHCLKNILTLNDLTRLSHNAREKALKNFGQSTFINATLTLYQDLLNAT